MGFSKDFLWGVATAAYQIEGAAYEDGKGLSVWDTFCKQEGKVKDNQTGEVACDHYHRYEEDIELMAKLGVKAYRFSISWTRILPNGIGEINQKGIDFYNNLINCLLKHNITPLITLFHWDYPEALEQKGAWLNEDSPKWFEEYAQVAAKAFGDRVKHFITFNEPQVFLGAGYESGRNAPGKTLPVEDTVLMSHNIMLAHGLAVKKIRENVENSIVGYAPTCGASIPVSDSEADIEAAKMHYFDVNKYWIWSVSWWSDPVFLGRYPEETEAFKLYGKYLPKSYKEDLKIINQPLDFYGQNIYNGALYKSDCKGGYEWVPNPVGIPITAMDWPVTPEALYWGPKFLYERYGLPVLISENGMADLDKVFLDGKVHDPHRIDFLTRYLREYKRAADDGVELMGYCLWSFMDNMEWDKGYGKRFGIVFVDYETQQRIPKDSYYWYKDIIADNGEKL